MHDHRDGLFAAPAPTIGPTHNAHAGARHLSLLVSLQGVEARARGWGGGGEGQRRF